MTNESHRGMRGIKPASGKSAIVAEIPAACADELKAVEFFERQRWGDSVGCPRCGDTDVYQVPGKDGQRHKRFLWNCRGCKQQFTVRIGTILEDSRIPFRHWAYAFWAACSSKKGVSALQIRRMTGLSYKSALFLMHRIRFAMTPMPGSEPKLSGIVEADETFVGGHARNLPLSVRRGMFEDGKRIKRGRAVDFRDRKTPVVALLERGGSVRAMVMPSVTAANVREVIARNVEPSAVLMTDESGPYTTAGRTLVSAHHAVCHSRHEYVRGEVSTNAVEGFFSRLKRQMYGTHHAVSRAHLHRYVAEVAFKHNTRKMEDGARTVAAIQGGVGKRLRYKAQA